MAMSGSSAKRLEAMILQMKLCIEEFAACAVSVGFQLLFRVAREASEVRKERCS
jgi:hypothetical protein